MSLVSRPGYGPACSGFDNGAKDRQEKLKAEIIKEVAEEVKDIKIKPQNKNQEAEDFCGFPHLKDK